MLRWDMSWTFWKHPASLVRRCFKRLENVFIAGAVHICAIICYNLVLLTTPSWWSPRLRLYDKKSMECFRTVPGWVFDPMNPSDPWWVSGWSDTLEHKAQQVVMNKLAGALWCTKQQLVGDRVLDNQLQWPFLPKHLVTVLSSWLDILPLHLLALRKSKMGLDWTRWRWMKYRVVTGGHNTTRRSAIWTFGGEPLLDSWLTKRCCACSCRAIKKSECIEQWLAMTQIP